MILLIILQIFVGIYTPKFHPGDCIGYPNEITEFNTVETHPVIWRIEKVGKYHYLDDSGIQIDIDISDTQYVKKNCK